MLLHPELVPPLLPPLAVIAIPPPSALIRDSIPVSYFLFHFLPSSSFILSDVSLLYCRVA
ncbi:hypothetical protein Godav_002845 [Gossypium davidsonii]|uniref:Uncharacterized protein n=1 Tax=Gossypium davidsonii TaxID=34287 RepID=A0A7J8SXV6_GOSDV|nr:hypothetical protein [Gossypium davidsonii]